MTIVNDKILEPDTIDEFIEAAKIFDHDNDGLKDFTTVDLC